MTKFVGCNEVSLYQGSFCLCFVVVFFFFYHWGKEIRSLYRGPRYIEVRYIEVPLYPLLLIAVREEKY